MFDMIMSRGLTLHRGDPIPGIYRVEGEAILTRVIVFKKFLGPEEAYNNRIVQGERFGVKERVGKST